MTYGTIKVDTVTFTNAGVDKSVTLSGLVQNPVFSGNVTVTGTLSGVTVTGTTANFTSGNFTNISGGTHTITSGVFATGSAASPSITFTGDLNTGIYSPGADQVAISTGGSGRLFVDASGNVGVGTATPNTMSYGGGVLGIFGAGTLGGNIWLTSETTAAGNRTGRIGFGTEGNTVSKETARIWSLADGTTAGNLGGNLLFNTKADGGSLTERLRITSAGLVGVGTSTPSAVLHAVAANDPVLFLNRSASDGEVARFLVGGNTAFSFSTTAGGIRTIDGGNADFRIRTNSADRLTVTSSGNVGVGTTSPAANLHIQGTTGASLRIQAGSTNAAQIDLIPGGTSNPYYVYVDSSRNFIFQDNASERARIDSSGRLLVGTSNQDVGGAVAGVKLNPSGQIFASSDTAGLFLDNPFYGDRRNTAGDGPIYVLARHGYYKAAIGCTTGGGTANEGVLTFYTGTNSGFNERARIDGSGRVGIGTSSPSSLYRLDVAGALLSSGSSSEIAIANRATNAAAWAFYSQNGEFNIYQWSAATSRLVIDSSGRVGIGTTSPGQTLAVAGNIGSTDRGSSFGFGLPDWRIYNSSTGNALVVDNYTTEAFRVDSFNRLLVGTSSARANFFNSTLSSAIQVEGDNTNRRISVVGGAEGYPYVILGRQKGSTGQNVSVSSADGLGAITFQGNDGSEFVEAATIEAYVDGTPGANDMPGRLVFSTTADGASSPTERMRIKNNGAIYMRSEGDALFSASALGAGSSNVLFCGRHSSTGIDSGTNSFLVFTNGNVTNTNNSYGAISDIKLKENIVNATSQWSDIKALQVRKYNFKEGQTHTQIGLVAQEVELVSPGLVSESPDRDAEGNDLGTVTKSVNYSVLYMKAVKALQEAMERIELLEARLDAANL